MAVWKYLDNKKWNKVDTLNLTKVVDDKSVDTDLPTAKAVYTYGLTKQSKHNLTSEITKESTKQQVPSARAVYNLFTGV